MYALLYGKINRMSPAEKEERINKLHKELTEMVKQKSTFPIDAKVDRAKNAITIKRDVLPPEITFKVSRFLLVPQGIALLVVGAFFTYAMILMIHAYIFAISVFGFIFFIGFTAAYSFIQLNKRLIVLNKTGITIEKDTIAWNDVLECFVLQYPIRKHRRWTLVIALMNGTQKQYDIAGLKDIELRHYIHHYMKASREEAVTSQPS